MELSRRHADVLTIDETMFDRLFLLGRKIFNKVGWDLGREDFFSHVQNVMLRRKVSRLVPDVIVSVAASQKIARLRSSAPIVHVSDATFAAMRDYYPRNFRSLSSRSLKAGDAMEQRVLTNSSAVMLSSHWAAKSAVDDYDVDPEKIVVAQFGANVAVATVPSSDMAVFLDEIDLLFVGVEWERKGGPIAYGLVHALRASGVKCRLHIVGCMPPTEVAADADVKLYGFLNKHLPADVDTLDRLFSSASFLVVPSRQEAYGLVFAEAAAYGLPVLATNTGGISSIVAQGLTGYLVDLDADADAFVGHVLSLRAQPEAYRHMREAARKRYLTHLTWAAWGDQFEAVLARVQARTPKAGERQ